VWGYLYVPAVEVGDGEVGVESDVLNCICGGEDLKPVLKAAQLAQDVIINVDLKAEDFSLLQHRLHSRVAAPPLALLEAD
jgi:hypothetical protein